MTILILAVVLVVGAALFRATARWAGPSRNEAESARKDSISCGVLLFGFIVLAGGIWLAAQIGG